MIMLPYIIVDDICALDMELIIFAQTIIFQKSWRIYTSSPELAEGNTFGLFFMDSVRCF